MSDDSKKATKGEQSQQRASVEHWAELRGYTPEFSRPRPPRPGVIMPLAHNPRYALFSRAKFHHQWVQGAEMTLAEFDDAVAASEAHPIRQI